MQTQEIDLSKFPISLNIQDDIAQLLPIEVVENNCVIRSPNGELMAHPYFGYIKVTNFTEILWKIVIDSAVIERQIIFFGHYLDSGEIKGAIGRLLESKFDIATKAMTATVLKNDLNPNVIPSFAAYMNGVYFFLGTQGTWYYDGTTSLVDKTQTPKNWPEAFIGLNFRGRLFMAGLVDNPGKIAMTTIGTETMDTADIKCGDNSDVITGLDGAHDSLYSTKENEVYEFIWTDNLANGILKTYKKAGCTYHTLLQRDLETLYFKNTRGAFIMNPKQIVSTGRELAVNENIIDVAAPIRNLIDNFQSCQIQPKIHVEDDFNLNDYYHVTQGTNVKLALSGVLESEKYLVGQQPGIKIRQGYYYGQSYKITTVGGVTGCIPYAWYVRLYRSGNEAINCDLKVDICADNVGIPGTPGEILKSFTIEKEDIMVGVAWYYLPNYTLENQQDYETTYWIKVYWNGNPGTQQVSWVAQKFLPNGPPMYLRGKLWSNDPDQWHEGWYYPWWNSNDDADFILMIRHYYSSGWIKSEWVEIPGIDYWTGFEVTENKPDGTAISYQLSPDDVNWYAVTPGGSLPDEIRNAARLKWKATLGTTNGYATPTLDMVKLTAIAIGEGKPMVSGFIDGRYYIMGYDTDDANLFIAFKPGDGWQNISIASPNYTYRQLFDPVIMNDLQITGVGKISEIVLVWNQQVQEWLETTVNTGVLFLALDPSHADYLKMPTSVKSGRLYFGYPELPKKERKISISYKGKSVVLYVYGDGWSESYNLPDATTSFGFKELNLDTVRFKWIQLKITTASDFKLKEFKTMLKIFGAGEK